MNTISIIIPVRNEAATIKKCIASISESQPIAEIIVVDGGTDETENIVKELAFSNSKIIYIKNHNDRGKGHAIKTGIKKATGSLIAQFDSDLQFDAKDLDKLFAPLINNQADMTLGSRFLDGSIRIQGSTPLFRTLGNTAISLFASILMFHHLSDILAGIKAWKKEVSDSFSLASDSYSYEAELAIKALQNKWRVLDVPVKTYPRIAGISSVSIFRTGWTLIFDILKFKLSIK